MGSLKGVTIAKFLIGLSGLDFLRRKNLKIEGGWALFESFGVDFMGFSNQIRSRNYFRKLANLNLRIFDNLARFLLRWPRLLVDLRVKLFHRVAGLGFLCWSLGSLKGNTIANFLSGPSVLFLRHRKKLEE